MKPQKYSPAHHSQDLAEIVCSNSLKSNLLTNACGLLKEELRMLNSLLIRIADKVAVPAGRALAVDRENFAREVTKALEQEEKIEIRREEIGSQIHLRDLLQKGFVILATGPLTSEPLSQEIQEITGQDKLYFYDAAAPILSKDSID